VAIVLTKPPKGDISTVAFTDGGVALMGRGIRMDLPVYLKVSTWFEEKEVNRRSKLRSGLSQVKSDVMIPNHAR